MLEQALAPGRIGRLTLPHRIVMGSMHLGLEALDDDGAALAAFYAERARGGAGLIVTGGWAVNREGTAGASYAVIGDPGRASALERIAAAVHAHAGARIALQLFHAGRYAAMGTAPEAARAVAPSAVASRFSPRPPRALSAREVERTADDFAAAAAHAVAAGFDAVEVMASEGYLINQFCSPLTNRRDDEWGGDAQRRARFGCEVVARIRAAIGPQPAVIVRISGADLMPGSSTRAETLAFARALVAAGADALDVGVGWHEARVPTVQALVPPGTWAPVAAAVRAAAGAAPVIASNRVNRLAHADALLAAGACDFVSMARPFLADPALVDRGRRGESDRVNLCIACNQACIDRSLADARVSCMVNPRAGRELEEDRADAGAGAAGAAGRFAVVGGGPAGLEAAHELARRGHRVVLHEAAGELGGQFRLARLIPGKEDYGATVAGFAARLAALGVELRLGEPLGADAVAAGRLDGVDGVVVATGTVPREPRLPGAELGHVLRYPEAIERAGELGGRVAIVGGGGVAVDLAHRLTAAARGFLDAHPLAAEAVAAAATAPGGPPAAAAATATPGGAPAAVPAVTLLCRGRRVGAGIGVTTRWALLDALRAAGARWETGVACRRIVPAGVELADGAGEPRLIAADTVVIAVGQEPRDELSAALAARGIAHRVVGGAAGGDRLDAVRAFADGHRAARELAAARVAA